MGLVDERLDKAGDIPEFITEIATGDNGIFGESLVHASRAATENTKAESVGAVFGDHIHGIDNVAFALGHLLAVGVENETMKINFAEGNFAGDIEAHHNHAGDPSEENVGAGFHDIKRVIRVFLAFGPVGTDDGPVGAREPGIKGVFVAVVSDATDFDFGEIYTGIKDPFGSVGGFGLAEHGNGDTPRNLTGNIPVFKAFEIIDENFLFAGGVEFDFAFLEVLNSGLRETLDVDEPLRFEHRFDDGTAFVAVSDGVGDFLGAAHEALAFEVAQNFLTGFQSGKTAVGFGNVAIHGAVFSDDRDTFEVMALANFKIVKIVGGGNLDGAGAVLWVGVFVGDDGDFAVGEGEFDKAADEVLIAGIIRVDRDGSVTE